MEEQRFFASIGLTGTPSIPTLVRVTPLATLLGEHPYCRLNEQVRAQEVFKVCGAAVDQGDI